MAYIGSTPTSQSFIAGTDVFNGTGAQVAYTLTRSVNSVNDIQIVVNNVVQDPTTYTTSGTLLTFSAAPSSGTGNIYVRYLSTTLQSVGVGDLSVSTAKIQTNAVTTDKILDASITAAKLNGAQNGSAPIYAARAWVNFNGTGTVAIRGSGNVSSVTDNGVGDYTVNFSTAMSDASYSFVGVCSGAYGVSGAILQTDTNSSGFVESAPTTTSCRVLSRRFGDIQFDATYIKLSVFR